MYNLLIDCKIRKCCKNEYLKSIENKNKKAIENEAEVEIIDESLFKSILYILNQFKGSKHFNIAINSNF